MNRCVSVAGAVFIAAWFSGCSGDIAVGDPSVEVASLKLKADPSMALRVVEIAQQGGTTTVRDAPPLANLGLCEELEISVRGDASLVGRCRGGDREATEVTSGMPITCWIHREEGFILCADAPYNNLVLDTSGHYRTPYIGGFGPEGPGLPGPGSGTPVPPGDQSGSPPGPPGGGGPGAADARQTFVEMLNEVIKEEGMSFSYTAGAKPTASNPFAKMFNDMFSNFTKGPFGGGASSVCTLGPSLNQVHYAPNTKFFGQPMPMAVIQGNRFSWDTPIGPMSFVARLTMAALERACKKKPADESLAGWSNQLYNEQQNATMWFMNSNGSIGFGPTSVKPGKTLNNATGPEDLIALGSPLVLDLEGNGLALTSAEKGVMFDLLGVGAYRTAWIEGRDDALLAIDLDESGSIDSGRELFGEGSLLGGRPARNGFEALGAVDAPAHGGNGNGLADDGDLMYGQLLLWTDSNRDGVSQSDELRSLRAAGITAVDLSWITSCATPADRHGNQMPYCSRYLRTDGTSGSLADVYLTR
jgi:hypothetical protein